MVVPWDPNATALRAGELSRGVPAGGGEDRGGGGPPAGSDLAAATTPVGRTQRSSFLQ